MKLKTYLSLVVLLILSLPSIVNAQAVYEEGAYGSSGYATDASTGTSPAVDQGDSTNTDTATTKPIDNKPALIKAKVAQKATDTPKTVDYFWIYVLSALAIITFIFCVWLVRKKHKVS